MERYLLILCSRKLKASLKGQKISRLLVNAEDSYTCRHCNESSFYSELISKQRSFVACFDFGVSDSNQGQIPSHKQLLCHWYDVSNLVIDEELGDGCLLFSLLEHLNQEQKAKDAKRRESRKFEDPVDSLHELADNLPQPGSYLLEVIIVGDADDMISPESCISLYGFLERLQLWHRAKINFLDLNGLLQIDQDCVSKPAFDSWKDAIEFGAVTNKGRSIILRQDILWSGDLLLRNENGCHTGVSGFEVRVDDDYSPVRMERREFSDDSSRLLLNDEIEVLKVLEDCDVPFHVYCPRKLKLSLRSECEQSSRYFFDLVKEYSSKNLCFLACFLYDVTDSPAQASSQLCTNKWIEYVGNDETTYLGPSDSKKYLHKRCMMIIRGSSSDDCLDLYFLKDLPCFDGDGLYDFLCHEHSLSSVSGNDILAGEWNLPLLSTSDVLQCQLNYLKELLESLNDSTNYHCPSKMLIEYGFTQSLREPSIVEIGDILEEKDRFEYQAATMISPLQWLERQAWNSQEINASMSLRGSLKRLQSGDTHMKLKGLPVSAEKHNRGYTENFLQLLNLFNASGEPILRDLKKIPLVADRLLKQLPIEEQVECVANEVRPCVEAKKTNSDAVRDLGFSKATQFFGHGIDYCLDSQNALKLDAKLSRIQDRFICEDTKCTWNLIQNYKPVVEKRCVREPENKENDNILKDQMSLPSNRRKRMARKNPRKDASKKKKCPMRGDKKDEAGTSAGKEDITESNSTTKMMKDDVAKQSDLSKESRSQRHQRRLKVICDATLEKYGRVCKTDPVFERCSDRLFTLCKSFLKDLKTSEGLTAEMKRIAKCNVQQVVDFEKRGK